MFVTQIPPSKIHLFKVSFQYHYSGEPRDLWRANHSTARLMKSQLVFCSSVDAAVLHKLVDCLGLG